MFQTLMDMPKQDPRDPSSPETIARKRKLAEALMAKGADYSPVQHWTQGMARVAEALVGGLQERRLDGQEAEGRAGFQKVRDAMLSALTGGGDTTSSIPAAQTGAPGTSPTVDMGAGAATPPITSPTMAQDAGGHGRVMQAVNDKLPGEARAFLDTVAGTESPDYRTRYGGSKFDSFADHPRIGEVIRSGPNAGRTSAAAGRYQFLPATWDGQARKLGLTDFSPASQDAAAWDLAQTNFRQKTGQDLLSTLKSGDPRALALVGQALHPTWTSLPGGIEAGTNDARFARSFGMNLGRYGQPQTADIASGIRYGGDMSPQQIASATPMGDTSQPPYNPQAGLDELRHAKGGVQVASADPNFVPQMPAAPAPAAAPAPSNGLPDATNAGLQRQGIDPMQFVQQGGAPADATASIPMPPVDPRQAMAAPQTMPAAPSPAPQVVPSIAPQPAPVPQGSPTLSSVTNRDSALVQPQGGRGRLVQAMMEVLGRDAPAAPALTGGRAAIADALHAPGVQRVAKAMFDRGVTAPETPRATGVQAA